ncbi:MAG: O-antigen ligase family protein [Actinobacteria bacterium]|nr:O-antigen ligase family protein [Actinomycetota bacterium]
MERKFAYSLDTKTTEITTGILIGLLLGFVVIIISSQAAKVTPVYLLIIALILVFTFIALGVEKRREIFLGLFAFSVSLSAVDKWFLPRAHYGGAVGIQISLSDLLLLILYGMWLGRILTSAKGIDKDFKFVRRGVVPALLFVFASALSVFNAPDLKLLVFELFQMFKMLLWYFFIINNIKSENDLKIIIGGVIVSVFLHSTVALLQKFSGASMGLTKLGELSQLVGEPVGGKIVSRIGGIMPHPIALGSFIAQTLSFCLGAFLTWKNKKMSILSGITIIFGFTALIFTLARAAMIAWVAAFVVTIFLAIRGKYFYGVKSKAIIGITLVILVVSIAFSSLWYERFFASRASNVTARYALNEIAVNMIKAHPLIGVGLNNFSSVITKYDTNGISLIFTDPVHNLFLLIFTETGIIGLLMFLWFLSVPLKAGTRCFLHHKDNKFITSVAVGGLVGILAFLIVGSVSWEFRISPLTQLFWLICGVLVATEVVCKKQKQVVEEGEW